MLFVLLSDRAKDLTNRRSASLKEENMFSQFLQDQVTIIHKDGTKHEGIRAMVQRGKVLTYDVSVPILTGETLERLNACYQVDKETFF